MVPRGSFIAWNLRLWEHELFGKKHHRVDRTLRLSMPLRQSAKCLRGSRHDDVEAERSLILLPSTSIAFHQHCKKVWTWIDLNATFRLCCGLFSFQLETAHQYWWLAAARGSCEVEKFEPWRGSEPPLARNEKIKHQLRFGVFSAGCPPRPCSRSVVV